jgi:hypothetical protein
MALSIGFRISVSFLPAIQATGFLTLTPGIDGVTFEAMEESGAESFLKQILDDLVANTYRPMPGIDPSGTVTAE